MRATTAQLNTLRTRPQSSQLYLSIFQPTTIFQAQINDPAISKGARTITYNNVTAGSWTAIEANFSVYIGSTPGASDIGRIRVRSATSSVLTVGENSNVEWNDDLYLTVVRFVQLDPIYPRIIQNPADIEDVIFYKDYDLAYTNQNRILGTFVNMGSDRAAFREGGSAQINYSSTGTYSLLGNSLSYSWFFEGGTPSGSTSANPGLVSYNSNGHFLTRLIVSGSSGEVDIGYRAVSIYDKPGQGSSVPILSWEMTSLNGSRDEAGYRASFNVHENIDIKENAIVVVFSDDWYGSTNQSIGVPGNEKIFFVGRVLRDSIQHDYQHSSVTFDAASLTEVMKSALGFSVSVESVVSPSKWYQLYDLDCRRAIYHYLRWHTTALNIADFQFVGADQKIQYFDADRTSMFDAVDNLMRNTLLGQVVSDRQGKVWMEVEAKAYPNPTGSYVSVMEITKRDWMNDPIIEERLSDDTSYLELGGVAYTGVNQNTFSALIASAPGLSPSFRGKVDTREGLALASQSQLNIMVGNVWANDNSQFPRISMDMTGAYRNLDIAPQEATFISIQPSDTVRNKLIEGLYIPSGFDWKYDSRNQILLPSIDFQNLVNGNLGDSVEIPISPADAGINGGFSVPGLQIPPLPIITIPPSYAGISQTVIQSFQADYGLYYRNAVGGTVTQMSRIISIIPSVITPTLMSVQFTLQKSGVYQCNLSFTADQTAPVGASAAATMAITGVNQIRGFAYGTEGTSGEVGLSGAISGILICGGGQIVDFSVTSQQALSNTNSHFFTSIIRISD